MARKPRTSNQPDITIQPYKIRFELERKKDGKLTRKGYMKIDYSKRVKDQEAVDARVYFPIVSIWAEEQGGNAVKCHAIGVKNLMQRDFVKLLLKAGGAVVSQSASQLDFQMQLLALQDGTIRYAPLAGSQFYVNDKETYRRMYFFDSKAFAIRHMLQFAGRYRTIGGLASTSFDSIPDDLLFECGFQKVNDLFNHGTPMWKGNPDTMFETNYSDRDRYIASFLTLLQNSLLQSAA